MANYSSGIENAGSYRIGAANNVDYRLARRASGYQSGSGYVSSAGRSGNSSGIEYEVAKVSSGAPYHTPGGVPSASIFRTVSSAREL